MNHRARKKAILSNDQKVVVDVKDIGHGEILYTDTAGGQRTYYPSGQVWLEVQTLAVQTLLAEPKTQEQEPKPVIRVLGSVALANRSISVVGDPESKTDRLAISFEAVDWPTEQPAQPAGLDDPLELASNLGHATLGFNRAIWDLGTPDDWFVACYLPKAFMDSLVASIRAEQIHDMQLGLVLRHLYTTDHPMAPPKSRGPLFLRPGLKDNTLDFPQLAKGFVSSIHFQSAPRELHVRAAEVVQLPEPEIAPLPYQEPEPAPAPVATSINALAARVDQLRGTLKWIGAFIVLALLFVAGR